MLKIKEAIKIYNLLKDNEDIKSFEEARHLILEKMNNREVEKEFYKSSSQCDYYIEKPYKYLTFSNDKVVYKKYGYNGIYKNKNGNRGNFCLSLCNYGKNEIINIIERHIEEDNLATKVDEQK